MESSDDKASDAMDIITGFEAKVSLILSDSDTDVDAKISLVTADFADLLGIFPYCTEQDQDFISKNPWIPPSVLFASFLLLDDAKSFPWIRRDDWYARDAACDAIFQSFVQVLEQLHHPGAHFDCDVNQPTKVLSILILTRFRQCCTLLSIENSSFVPHFTALVTKIAEIAEHVIGLCANQLSLLDDDVQDHEYWIKMVVALMIGGSWFPLDACNSTPENDSEVLDDDLVGLCGDLKKIKERLLCETKQLEIIPITGMGGIGKTTLATRVYEDPEIIRHFHVLAWTTVSQKYQKIDILLRLLQSTTMLNDEKVSKQSYEQLGELLCRRLRGRRYLIVVDDIWSMDDWDDIRQWFPDDENCSRIILTSRLAKVGVYASSGRPPHFMNFLCVEDSKSLLFRKVFLKKTCPPDLVNFGWQIAEKCQGLPLAIAVIAGHLSKTSMTTDSWENVSKRIGSLTSGIQDPFFQILSLSYDDLHHNLKSCFLYMGTFPKNSEISVQKLVRLWTAAGFLQDERSNLHSLEEMAEKCLEELISRNLILVKRNAFDGRVKTCGIHDLLCDLSLIKARQEGEDIFGPSPFTHTDDDMKYLMGLTSSYLYDETSLRSKSLNSVGFIHLRVLDVLLLAFIYFPDEITELINLRYLALSTYGRIPGSVWKLRHLETLINDHRWACAILPEEIWLLPRLRHLHVGTCAYVPDPSNLAVGGSCISSLLDLQTLSSISFTSCTKEVFVHIPNVKNLEIYEIRQEFLGDGQLFDCLSNLVYLHGLQKLKLRCRSAKLEKPRCIPSWNSFVPNIKHLTLCESRLVWKEMNNLAMLPNLEVLKLKKGAFEGQEWEQFEVFPQLKFLLLQSLDLVHWKADKDHFPNLQGLVIRGCIHLLAIPNEFGEIPTLQSIHFDYSNLMTGECARKVQTEQQDMGNDEFDVSTGHHIPIEHRLMWLTMVFVYMTLRLKKQREEKESSCNKTEKE